MRTTEEVVARIKFFETNNLEDFFAAQRLDLISTLPFEQAKEYLTAEGVEKGEEAWEAKREGTDDKVLGEMVRYMPFAIGKATGHRGLSAGRSLDHYRAWTWFLGDSHYEDIDWENYAQYGAPILRQICEVYDIEFDDTDEFANMSRGMSCRAGCMSGCGGS